MKKLLPIFTLLLSLSVTAQTDLIISEYVEGWSTNRALEIYNPTSEDINLSGYQVARYSNGSSTAGEKYTITLPNYLLKPYMVFVAVVDKRDPNGENYEAPVWKQLQERADAFLCPVYDINKTFYWDGNDAVVLQKTNGTQVDLFARIGSPEPKKATIGGSNLTHKCWTDTPPHFEGVGLGITADHTMVRKPDFKNGITTNPMIWDPLAEWDTLPANTFSTLGWHEHDFAPANETPVFAKNEYKFALVSDSENETIVGTIVAVDKEKNDIKYYINYGNYIYIGEGDAAVRIEPFELNKTTGVLTLVDKTGLAPEVVDTFNIKVVATNGFSQTGEILVQVLIDGEVGVINKVVENKISIFPNPTKTNGFSVKTNKTIKQVIITNIIGQEVFTLNQVYSKNLSVNIPEALKGIYLIQVKLEDQSTSTTKVIFK